MKTQIATIQRRGASKRLNLNFLARAILFLGAAFCPFYSVTALDANGNVGYEGFAIPLLNLRSVASRNVSYGGGSGEHKSVLSTWDRTGTAVFAGVGVLTSGGSWYPGQ